MKSSTRAETRRQLRRQSYSAMSPPQECPKRPPRQAYSRRMIHGTVGPWYSGVSWIFRGLSWFCCIFREFQGFSLIFRKFPRISGIFRKLQGFPLNFRDCPGISRVPWAHRTMYHPWTFLRRTPSESKNGAASIF